LRVLRDEDLIESARNDATELVDTDNDLSAYPLLQAELKVLQADEAVDYLDKG
jgi:ATP-dependent DNA helicase RecG